jgi:hypothetical protein
MAQKCGGQDMVTENKYCFNSASWIKIVIPIGILLFLAMGIELGKPALKAFQQKNWTIFILLGSLSLWVFYLCYLGLSLFKFRNVKLELTDESIKVLLDGFVKEYRWDSGLRAKENNSHQVYELFDKENNRLFMIDYHFPRFRILRYLICKKLENSGTKLIELTEM